MKYTKTLWGLLLVTIIAGCNSVTGIKNFTNCEFKFGHVSNVKLADIDLTDKETYSNFNLSDLAKLGIAYAQKELDLNMDVNMKIKNPNKQSAQLDGMDFILWIDNQEMLEGTMNKKIVIEAGEEANVSLPISLNLYKSIKEKKMAAIAEFALGLSSKNAETSRVKVSLKPFFTVMGQTVKMPSYITIGGDQAMPERK
ncbi:MAG: LEA type 2 family protein [Paludibacteraceae bacterium]|nr:LEA type 2 family protein [Paludibacteraceae bacterium]